MLPRRGACGGRRNGRHNLNPQIRPIVVLNKCDLVEDSQAVQSYVSAELPGAIVVALSGLSGDGVGILVDTPGMREVQIWADDDTGTDSVAAAFPEITELEGECRFRDCRHEHEPGCGLGGEEAFLIAVRRLGNVSAILVNLYPSHNPNSTALLVGIHLPIALWFLLGLSYSGSVWRRTGIRMDFVRFTGEAFIYALLIRVWRRGPDRCNLGPVRSRRRGRERLR